MNTVLLQRTGNVDKMVYSHFGGFLELSHRIHWLMPDKTVFFGSGLKSEWLPAILESPKDLHQP